MSPESYGNYIIITCSIVLNLLKPGFQIELYLRFDNHMWNQIDLNVKNNDAFDEFEPSEITKIRKAQLKQFDRATKSISELKKVFDGKDKNFISLNARQFYLDCLAGFYG